MTDISPDEQYMREALKEAKKAYKKDEVPVGAIIVDDQGHIIAKAFNSGEHGQSAIEHAEIKALIKAAKKLHQSRLWECSMYVTLEPCPMCAAAISQMRIKKLVFGAENEKGGAVINGVKFYNSPTCNHKPEILSGVLKEVCASLLKNFFKEKRK